MSRWRSVNDRVWSRFTSALPARWLRRLGKLNVPVYRLSRGRLMNKISGAPVLLLTTTGRRSGQLRTTPVIYMREGESFAVIGSNAGNPKTPAWAHNLTANPDAEIQLRSARQPVSARIVDGDERAQLWRQMNAQYSGFDHYDALTTREISVFLLEPRAGDA